MYGSQNAAGTLVSFYAFMTMPVPMLLFVQNTVSESVRWIPQVICTQNSGHIFIS